MTDLINTAKIMTSNNSKMRASVRGTVNEAIIFIGSLSLIAFPVCYLFHNAIGTF